MTDSFAHSSELLNYRKIYFIEDRDKTIEVHDQNVFLILKDLVYLATSDLLIVENLIVFDIHQAKRTSHTNQCSLFKCEHSVVSGVAIAHSGYFGRDFGWMSGNPMNKHTLLHFDYIFYTLESYKFLFVGF